MVDSCTLYTLYILCILSADENSNIDIGAIKVLLLLLSLLMLLLLLLLLLFLLLFFYQFELLFLDSFIFLLTF